MQSQKTFANHLDDWIAFQSVARDNPQATAPWAPPAPPSAAAAANLKQRSTPSSHKAKPKSSSTPAAPKPEPPGPDIAMPDADGPPSPPATSESLPHDIAPPPPPPPTSYPPDGTVLPPYNRPPPRPHPGDADPLLASRVVPFPSDEELRTLMTAPPLSYLEARGADSIAAGGGPYPERKFCEVCGYWGRVKCGKCGGRVCALDCLETHRDECLRRYGL